MWQLTLLLISTFLVSAFGACTSLPNSCQELAISIPARGSTHGYYGLNTNLNNTKVNFYLATTTFSGGWYKYWVDFTEQPGCPGTGSYRRGTFTASNSTPVFNLQTAIYNQNQVAVAFTLACDDVIESCSDTFKVCVVYS